MEVKPTMSLKQIVTLEKLSAITDLPCFKSSAIDLNINKDNAGHKLKYKLEPKLFKSRRSD